MMSVRTRISRLVLAFLLIGAVAAPIAQAQDPTGVQYQNGVNQIEDQVGGGGDNGSAAPTSSESSSAGPLNSPVVSGLPFTGLDVVALCAVAVALVSLGLVLRRLTVPRPIE